MITSVDKGKSALTNSFLLLDDNETKRFEDEAIEVRRGTNVSAEKKTDD